MNGRELMAFLLARIDEEEAAARPATPSEDSNAWHAPDGSWFPSRVRAECVVRRRLIELHSPTLRYVEERELCDREPRVTEAGWDVPVELLVLAAPYVDHPEFRPAWRLGAAS